MAVHIEDTTDPNSNLDRGVLDAEKNKLDDVQIKEFDLVEDAREATNQELNMSLWESFKLYPKAVGWSVLLSATLIMEGYDVVLIGSFYAYPAFNRKFGTLQPDGKGGESYSLSAAWQSGLSNGAAVGEILGLFINGIVSERYGYRKTMMVSLIFLIACIFIPFFAPNVQTLQAGEVLMGIPWGVFQTLSTTYAAEVCPVVLRSYLTTWVNMCWVIGQLIASGVLRGLLDKTGDLSYKIPFAIQWIWPVPILIGVFLAPESPWWLVRKGRTQDAVHAVKRLTSKTEGFDAEKTVAMMVHTDKLERKMTEGASYWDCFKSVDFRRTEIACITWSIQNCCSSFQGYSTYFFEQAGLPDSKAFDLSIGLYALGMLGTFISWFLMKYLGRRTIYIWGLIIMDICLLIIGFLTLAPSSNNGAKWGIGIMLLLETFFYDCTVGSVCYSIVPEISSSRLRTKTIVLARNLYNVIGIINGILVPHMLNTNAWNWGAKAGFFYGGIVFLCLVWTYFRLPEPKGRTYAELDVLFEKGVSARKFSSTQVDIFASDNDNPDEVEKVNDM